MTITPLIPDDPEAAAFFADARAALNPPPRYPPARPAGPKPTATEPDLSDLAGMPPSAPPDRRLLAGRSWLGTGAYLTAKDRHAAATEAAAAATAQANGADPTAVFQFLARAEDRAPAQDKAWHAARLDAYAAAHGIRGWYRRMGRDGSKVNLMQLRTWEAGDRGRYFAHESQGLPSPALRFWVVDRDTGKTVYRTFAIHIANQWIDEAESPHFSPGPVTMKATTPEG